MPECRLCLKNRSKSKLISIFHVGKDNRKTCEKIHECTSVEISEYDEFPKVVCNYCLKNLTVAYRFRQECRRNDSKLRKRLKILDDEESPLKVEVKQEVDSNETTARLSHTADEADVSDDDSGPIADNDFCDDAMVKIEDACEDTSVKPENALSKAEKKESTVKKKKRGRPITKREKSAYCCEVCGQSFQKAFMLENHLKRHRGEKPFKCSECGNTFVTKSEMRKHSFRHTGAKPYSCKFCGRLFADGSSKIKHERLHLNQRPYKCNLCEKDFAYSYSLKAHLVVHSGAKDFTCRICNNNFRMKYHLLNHLRRKHKELTVNQVASLAMLGNIQPTVEDEDESSPTAYNENDNVYNKAGDESVPKTGEKEIYR